LADKELTASGQIPGNILTTENDRNFLEGNVLIVGEPRFSDAYGDLRHIASILEENHSLNPYRKRVLGTYVLLESTLKILAIKGLSIKKNTIADRARRAAEIPIKWKVPQMIKAVSFVAQSNFLQKNNAATLPDSLLLAGIQFSIVKFTVSNAAYVE